MPRKAKEIIEEQPIIQNEAIATEQENSADETAPEITLLDPKAELAEATQIIETASITVQTAKKSTASTHTPFSYLNVRELDKNLSADEMQEWNSIYASFRSKSILSGEVTGVDENQFEVTNVDTGQRETKKILSLVIIKYRVKILIPESEIWAVGDDRPSYVARGMIGATVDFVITNIDREGEVAIASRSMANHKRRRLFDSRKNAHKTGDIVPCRVLAVGPKKCLVECGGYDISLSQRDLSYTAIADLRAEYHMGQELQAVIKEFLPKDSKLLISVKEINPNPFDGAQRRHPIGSRRQGVISGKYKGGIFCTLSDKVVCLCLYSNAHFDTEFFTGDRVLIQITQYDYQRQLIYGRIVTKL